MNTIIEEKFVNTFVIKDKRKRILYELSSTKKRAVALQRLYNVLDKKLIVFESLNMSDNEVINEAKNFFEFNKECYIISETTDDGNMLPFEKALKNMLSYEVNYVIIYDEKTVMVAKEYDTYGMPTKRILQKA